MQVEVKIPPLSESISEAALMTWRKKPGEAVKRDELLIELETDKVVLEITAPNDGVLSAIKKGDGEKVTANEVVATIDTEGKASVAAPTKAEATPKMETAASTPQTDKQSPAVRKMIEEKALNPQTIAGSGKGGRVTKGDVLEHLQRPATSAVTPPHERGARQEKRVAITPLRARVAERLKNAQNTAAILTTFNEVNMHPVMELRNRYKEQFEKQHGAKLGFMSFFTQAVVAALQKFPIVNASIDNDAIVYHDYCDIGVAVSSSRGLVVPIVRNAETLSFADIEKTIADFGARARDNKLTMDDLTGGTFSISNGGVFGSLLSTPIINPPQSAILGMHKIQERPIAEQGQVVIRPIMYVALSYDHRIIDGRDAVSFLVTIKDLLEDPARMLLKV